MTRTQKISFFVHGLLYGVAFIGMHLLICALTDKAVDYSVVFLLGMLGFMIGASAYVIDYLRAERDKLKAEMSAFIMRSGPIAMAWLHVSEEAKREAIEKVNAKPAKGPWE